MQRCGRLDEQVALLRHKLYLIQQGMAFNGKRTKTARSQGKKFQVSVEQEATRLLGNLGWALMQQNNYIEAEDAYRRALLIAPDNNKMCNMGICLMKQGRIDEAKETLRRVKPAMADGPRGVDSHLKAYERAQQMLQDLESELINKGGDWVEQSKLFDAFLGSSAIWQPQPCKEPIRKFSKPDNEFPDENVNSNIIKNPAVPPVQKSVRTVVPWGNSLNIDAPPFFSSKFAPQFPESLKRTRSGNAENSSENEMGGKQMISSAQLENEIQKPASSMEKTEDKWADLLPDSEDFENAIIAAVLGSDSETKKAEETRNDAGFPQRKVDKRLKVFQDITLSLSPRA
ncbi:POLLENLESS 3-LIKE 2 [Olea europaea subsp. europaea]|uniref:POLLENLESS 3-LIKE 2 n=1 Tax=Olea europaea subsp. europaea TaxID=158383 RepID=A0A8S0UJ27_OLEEU|nr:POLLENLESS 3-LIKE 2 [Olea europaea subsp. europaea]